MSALDSHRWLRRLSAAGMILAGAAMLVLPGPGVLTILGGLALLERDLPAVSRGMDRVRRLWSKVSPTG
ncbi:MAG: PGPGW domain-containing protein [Myxococcota bacterium]